jgi:hypothetical protein
MRQPRYRHSLALYESVLEHFLREPESRTNLHRGWVRRLAASRPHRFVQNQ